jgi:hypothetical protein
MFTVKRGPVWRKVWQVGSRAPPSRMLTDFYGDMPQIEIGRRLGVSQMHVSRLRAHALGYLGSRLLDLEEQAS